VTRHEDTVAVARDTATYSDEMRVSDDIRSPFRAEVQQWMQREGFIPLDPADSFKLDGELHARRRKLVAHALPSTPITASPLRRKLGSTIMLVKSIGHRGLIFSAFKLARRGTSCTFQLVQKDHSNVQACEPALNIDHVTASESNSTPVSGAPERTRCAIRVRRNVAGRVEDHCFA
jgi:hypothetical protein